MAARVPTTSLGFRCSRQRRRAAVRRGTAPDARCARGHGGDRVVERLVAKRQRLAAGQHQRAIVAPDPAALPLSRLEREVNQDVRARRGTIAGAHLEHPRIRRYRQPHFGPAKRVCLSLTIGRITSLAAGGRACGGGRSKAPSRRANRRANEFGDSAVERVKLRTICNQIKDPSLWFYGAVDSGSSLLNSSARLVSSPAKERVAGAHTCPPAPFGPDEISGPQFRSSVEELIEVGKQLLFGQWRHNVAFEPRL